MKRITISDEHTGNEFDDDLLELMQQPNTPPQPIKKIKLTAEQVKELIKSGTVSGV